MTAPLYGAKFAIIGSGEFMPQILALGATLDSVVECKKESGWEHSPTVKIYELIEVG
jgi:hypothetical protein